MVEAWISLDRLGFSSYEISSHGRVRNSLTTRVLALTRNQAGVHKVNLYDLNLGKCRTLSVARLVAEAFDVKPIQEDFNTIIHLDGNRENLRVDNLVWRPRWFAIKYHQQFDRAPLRFKKRIVLKQTGEVFETAREVAIKYGLHEEDIMISVMNRQHAYPTGFRFQLEE